MCNKARAVTYLEANTFTCAAWWLWCAAAGRGAASTCCCCCCCCWAGPGAWQPRQAHICLRSLHSTRGLLLKPTAAKKHKKVRSEVKVAGGMHASIVRQQRCFMPAYPQLLRAYSKLIIWYLLASTVSTTSSSLGIITITQFVSTLLRCHFS
jgi:hypothetical protein